MMIKKISTGALALALVLGSAGVAVGYGGRYYQSSSDLSIKNDDTVVINYASAQADTGDNEQEVESFKSSRISRRTRTTSTTQSMTTGNAGADALADVNVNGTYVEADCGCLCGRCGSDVSVDNDDIFVMNGAEAEAETGDNEQEVEGMRRTTTQSMRSGDSAALSTAYARVNMTDLRISR